jgi:hypothetical protein
LRLEDFQPDAGAASHPQVTLRLTRGGIQQLVAKPNPEGAAPVLEAEQEELLPLHRYWRHVSPFGVMAQLQRLMSHKTLPICCDKLP